MSGPGGGFGEVLVLDFGATSQEDHWEMWSAIVGWPERNVTPRFVEQERDLSHALDWLEGISLKSDLVSSRRRD